MTIVYEPYPGAFDDILGPETSDENIGIPNAQIIRELLCLEKSLLAGSQPISAAVCKDAASRLATAHPHPVETVQADVQPVAIQRYEFDGGSVWCGEAASMTPDVSGDYVLFTDHQATVAALEADLKHLRSMAGKSRGELEASLAEMQRELDAQKARGDNHWETLRSIREMAKEGDCDRIILWVNDAGSGYTETAEMTLKTANDALTACQREKEGLREAATNLFHSLPDILDEAAFGGNYSKLCDFTDAVHAVEAALKSEGA